MERKAAEDGILVTCKCGQQFLEVDADGASAAFYEHMEKQTLLQMYAHRIVRTEVIPFPAVFPAIRTAGRVEAIAARVDDFPQDMVVGLVRRHPDAPSPVSGWRRAIALFTGVRN